MRDKEAHGENTGLGEAVLTVSYPDKATLEHAESSAKDVLDRDSASSLPRAPLTSVVETDFDIIL